MAVACIAFLALTLYRLDLPGLYADEAFDVIPAMQLLLGHQVELQRNTGLHLFGLDLPLMSSSDYQGVTSTYLVLPFFALGGINVISLRLMTVAVGLVGVVLTYFLARAWFGVWAARAAVLLVAVSPAWVFWSRIGVYVVSQVMPVAIGALLCFTLWVRRGGASRRSNNKLLYGGMFLLGLGLTTKLLFIWMIVAVAGAAVLLWVRPAWEHRRKWLRDRTRWVRLGALSLFWFCVGAFPFLLYNFLTGGTFDLLRHTVSQPGTTSNGVNNAAYLRNLWTSADDFKVLLDGGYFWFQGAGGVPHANAITPALFALSALGLVGLVLYDRARGRLQRSTTATMGRTVRVALIVLAASLLLALALATGVVTGKLGGALVIVVALGGLAAAALLARSALLRPATFSVTSWGLAVTTGVAGAVWWFAGSGRPAGTAPDSLLGLWPVDAAGALFWVCGAALLLVLGADAHPVAHQRTIVAALAITGLIVAQSAVTVSGLWSTHLLVMLPLPYILIADFCMLIGRRIFPLRWPASGRYDRLRSAAPFIPLLLLVGANVLLDVRVAVAYHRDLAITGGLSTFSDAIYPLAEYLERDAGGRRVVALDWGFKRPVQLLTQDRVNPNDAYGYEEPPSDATVQSIRSLVASDPNALYLFRTEQGGIAYPRFDIFEKAARDAGHTPVIERTFYQRDGTPVYQVYGLR